MRLRWGSQLDPKFMLGAAGAYLILGTADLLLFVLGRHQVRQGRVWQGPTAAGW